MSPTSAASTEPSTGAPIQPLHNPSQAAKVVHPQAPLGTLGNQAPGMGAKALLAKKMSKSAKPSFVSPTDKMMTPCSQKLSETKKKHFQKGPKPVQLFAPKEETASSDEEMNTEDKPTGEKENKTMVDDDDENPF